MLIEIHMIQNHAPSNLNRDDTGSPKVAMFGGKARARLSSQCIKHSIRKSPLFRDELQKHLGTRTRRLPGDIRRFLLDSGCDASVADVIRDKAIQIGRTEDSKDQGKDSSQPKDSPPETSQKDTASDDADQEKNLTKQLIFYHDDEVPPLALRLKELYEELGQENFKKLTPKELNKKLAGSRPKCSVDIALFGRMTTSAAFEDIHAALQVAHAFSTAKLEREFDYFTAVDDRVEAAEEKGAGMIGDVEFNSATYYKYFSLDWETLLSNLGGDTEEAEKVSLETAKALLRAAALTTPSGKQNTFAAHNPPDAVLVEIKPKKIPMSYANAFVKPVTPNHDRDLVEASIERLTGYAATLKSTYSIKTAASFWLTTSGQKMDGAEKANNLDELVDKMAGSIKAAMGVTG